MAAVGEISMVTPPVSFYQTQFVRLSQVLPEPFENQDRRLILMQEGIAGDRSARRQQSAVFIARPIHPAGAREVRVDM